MADDRTYIRVHDGMPGHPKVRGLSDRAFRTLIRAWCYCSEYLTDGEVVAVVARDLGTAKAWNELLSTGLAEAAPSGYLMHDYLEHQRSAAEVAEIKAGRGAGGNFGNHVKWHVKRRKPNPDCEHCKASGVIANRSQERYEDDSPSDRSPSHRSETEAQTERDISSRGVSHVSSDALNEAPLYPDHCADHQEPVPPKCGGCQKQKAANRAAGRHLAAVTHSPSRPDWCGECDQWTRLRDYDGTPYRCPTCHPLAEESA